MRREYFGYGWGGKEENACPCLESNPQSSSLYLDIYLFTSCRFICTIVLPIKYKKKELAALYYFTSS